MDYVARMRNTEIYMARIRLLAERSEAWICGRSLAGIAGSNPTGIMDVCLLWVLCCQVEVSATGWSPVQRSSTVCGASECDREAWIMKRPWSNRGLCAMGWRGGGKVTYWLTYVIHFLQRYGIGLCLYCKWWCSECLFLIFQYCMLHDTVRKYCVITVFNMAFNISTNRILLT